MGEQNEGPPERSGGKSGRTTSGKATRVSPGRAIRTVSLQLVAERVDALGLTAGQARRVLETVRSLSVLGPKSPVVQTLERLANDRVEPSALEELLPVAEAVVELCIREATIDGAYPLPRARAVGRLAQALGLSVGRLSEI